MGLDETLIDQDLEAYWGRRGRVLVVQWFQLVLKEEVVLIVQTRSQSCLVYKKRYLPGIALVR